MTKVLWKKGQVSIFRHIQLELDLFQWILQVLFD